MRTETLARAAHAPAAAADSKMQPAAAAVRLGVLCTIGAFRFAGFLGHFRCDHRDVGLAIVEGAPVQLLDLLESGRLDLAILAQPGPFAARFDAAPLYRERFAAASPPGHRFRLQEQVPLREFHGEAYVDRLGCEYSAHIDELMRRDGVEVETVYASEREDWVQTLVMAGMGVACMPEYACLLPGIEAKPIVEPEIARDICLVRAAGRPLGRAAAVLARAAGAYNWDR